MSSTGVPTVRRDHAAVWGAYDQMVVWGGVSGSTYRGDGARYAPGTNTWTSMSTAWRKPSSRRSTISMPPVSSRP